MSAPYSIGRTMPTPTVLSTTRGIPALCAIFKILSKSQLIINSTSIGMHPNEDDSPTKIGESFNSNQLVFDIVYNPISTKLLKLAAREGAATINGLKMFVEQGAKSFELWTGKSMPKEEITEKLKEQLKYN